jgi:dolichol-phosphate mannosyltransferase
MKVIVVAFTYNEVKNIKPLILQILGLGSHIEVLVVDDDSPDKTAVEVESLKKKDSRVHLVCRKGKRGRGLAGKEGLQHALNLGADYIIEMDADFSHQPKYIPYFLNYIQNNDLVIGSRKIKGGRDKRSSFLRKQITNLAAVLIKKSLKIKISDPTSGYRCFRRKVLEGIDLNSLSSQGPFIVTEILYRCINKGYLIGEMPIEFDSRKKGGTKLNIFILLDYLIKLITMKIKKRKLKLSYKFKT